MLWVDLSTAGLIESGFNTATPSVYPTSDVTGAGIDNYYPKAKIGNGNYVYTINLCCNYATANTYYSSYNFFSISAITTITFSSAREVGSNNAISPVQAFALDKKMDDGLPISGRITAISSLNGHMQFANKDIDALSWGNTVPGYLAIAGSATTCYDNKNASSNPTTYSIAQNNGTGLNCSLSFRFQ